MCFKSKLNRTKAGFEAAAIFFSKCECQFKVYVAYNLVTHEQKKVKKFYLSRSFSFFVKSAQKHARERSDGQTEF